jgi:hypothetical protein
VKALLEAHGGAVLVEDRLEGGAVVQVPLPFDEEPNSPFPISREVPLAR